MSNTKMILIAVAVGIALGTLTFFIKRSIGFDFTPFEVGILMALIAFLIIKVQHPNTIGKRNFMS